MKKYAFWSIFTALITCHSTALYADCVHNGNIYAEGSVIGGYECKNSKWVK